jgi:uncharacterized membrane protein
MTSKQSISRYKQLYAQLLRLYPTSFYERFGEGMQQTFNDSLHHQAEHRKSVCAAALWMCVDTTLEIVKANLSNVTMNNKRMLRLVLVVVGLLMVPLVAMQFTEEVVWTLSDFVIAGGLLLGAGLAYEFVARRVPAHAYRIAVGVAVMTGLLLIWINLAVGIIGSEDNPANALYAVVLLIGFTGAILSRFKATGLARAFYVTAAAQFLVPIVAYLVYSPEITSWGAPGLLGVLILNGFFAACWLLAATLFRNAADQLSAA